MTPLLEVRDLTLLAPGGRVLLRDLDVTIEAGHVALVGRNGVGKSTLLAVLAGRDAPHRGSVRSRGERLLVPQELTTEPLPSFTPGERRDPALARELSELGLSLDVLGRAALSRGERRKLHLLWAWRRAPDLLLLDEPTEDLDIEAIDWLSRVVARHPSALLVATHHRQLLRAFRHFFVVEESGCRYFGGSFDALEDDLERRREEEQARYARKLNALIAREEHDVAVRRRRRRKKNLGRLHEERRAPCRAQLMGKKSYAEKSQARAAKIQEARIAAARKWVQAARRACSVQLPLDLALPALPEDDGRHLIALTGVTLTAGERTLVEGLDLRLGRERLGIVGPNGAGKTTLLSVLTGVLAPDRVAGDVRVLGLRLGALAQGASDWMLDESLLERLVTLRSDLDADAAAQLVVAHRFPLGLALRPMRTLSAGERARAALICLFQRAPEMLVLDEPTYSLDFVAAGALARSLAAWRGGLVVASHDRAFLAAIGVERCLVLDGRGGHRFVPLVPPDAPPLAGPRALDDTPGPSRSPKNAAAGGA